MERPKLKIRLTWIDYTIEAVSFLVVLLTCILFIVFWLKAPQIVPIHYNITGTADGFGSKSFLIPLLVFNIITYIGMSVLGRYPQIFNFPVGVTSSNAYSLYKVGKRMLSIIKLLFCIIFLYTIYYELKTLSILDTSTQKSNAEFIIVMGVILFCLCFSMIFSIVKMCKMGK
jgi:uncharacterized membrane protein